jgi:hypothetical protein
MEEITITMRDGEILRFKEKGRSGGSYTIRAKYVDGWLVITDEWEHETAYPSDRVSKVECRERTRW